MFGICFCEVEVIVTFIAIFIVEGFCLSLVMKCFKVLTQARFVVIKLITKAF